MQKPCAKIGAKKLRMTWLALEYELSGALHPNPLHPKSYQSSQRPFSEMPDL